MAFYFIGTGLGLTAAAGIFGTISQNKISNAQLSLAQDQQGKQDWSFQQLQQLITNPQSFFQSPVYTSAALQGTSAVERGEAAGGYAGSGNMAAALQSYGQSFGQQQLFNQEQLLAGMSGTSANPSTALSGASAATQAGVGNLSSLAGLASFFGTSGILGGGGGAQYDPYETAAWTNQAMDQVGQLPTYNPSLTPNLGQSQ